MSETAPDLQNAQFEPSVKASDRVAIAAIIATLVIILACICSCTLVAVIFFTNPPW